MMAEVASPRPKRDWRRGWGGPILVFVLLFLFSLWYLGVLAQTHILIRETPVQSYLYQDYSGSYANLSRVRRKMLDALPEKLRKGGSTWTLIESETGSPGKEKIQARVGIVRNAAPPAAWKKGEWPSQRVLQIDVHANPAIAAWKAYAALQQWSKNNGIALRYPLVEMEGPGDRYRLWMPLPSSRP